MSRKLKMKRQLIEEANKRLLGEQNEKLSDDYVDKMISGIQGLVAHEVVSGDNISKIIKDAERDGIYLLPFNKELNSHINDPNKIYPGDIIFFMTDPTGGKGRRDYINSLEKDDEEMELIRQQEKGMDKGRLDFLKSQDPDMFK